MFQSYQGEGGYMRDRQFALTGAYKAGQWLLPNRFPLDPSLRIAEGCSCDTQGGSNIRLTSVEYDY
jgi:hypothetical protein